MKPSVPVTKNESYTVSITGLGHSGEGICRIADFAVFVPGALPGDLARVKIVKVKKSLAFGRLEEILRPSPDRIAPPCPYAARCGGCTLQHMSYPAQLRYKAQRVQDALERIGGITGVSVPPALGMETPFRYRNKGQFPVGGTPGACAAGFYAPRSHRIAPIDACLLQHPVSDEVLEIVRAFLNQYEIAPYDETTHRGLVRHILTRVGFSTGEVMVCLVINGKKLPHARELAEALRAVPGVVSIVLNQNTEKTNVILGRRTEVLWGKDHITEVLCGLRFSISPLSFFQVNPVQTQKLYETALDFAALTGGETVLDIYCGIGSISLFFAKHAERVVGVEAVPEAVADAEKNAVENGIANASFFAGKAEEVIPRLYREEGLRADVVVLDPPRKGCEEAVLDTLLEMKAPKVVYVSCDPATLARDLRILLDGGYALEKVLAVDQFCQTSHVECVILMQRCGSGSKK